MFEQSGVQAKNTNREHHWNEHETRNRKGKETKVDKTEEVKKMSDSRRLGKSKSQASYRYSERRKPSPLKTAIYTSWTKKTDGLKEE